MNRPPVPVTAEAADYLRANAAYMEHSDPNNNTAECLADEAALKAWRATGSRVDPDPLPTEMPEPWPGMGVEQRAGDTVLLYIAHPIRIDGEWHMVPAGERPTAGEARRYLPLSEVVALYDGRTCIWRRSP